MTPMVEIDGLRHRYADGTEALRGISLTINPGEVVAVIGANGAGKSTLLQHLCGLLLPSDGRVLVDGMPLQQRHLQTIRQRVGMVFQDPDDQLFLSTVAEDVAFGPQNLGLPAAEVEQRTQEALEAVEAYHLRQRPSYRLSLGQKKRVAIATALAMSPPLLVMDEPTAGLDPGSRRRLIQLLQRLGKTLVISGHDLDMTAELCGRVIVLNDGILRGDGTPGQIFGDHRLLSECRLEPPLSQQGCILCRRQQ